MGEFFGKPTRGGILTIVNCLLWAIVGLGVATKTTLLLWPALIACWSIAWLAILPILGWSNDDEAVFACIAIGGNSLLWGYGISWLISIPERRRRRGRRGFDVIVNDATQTETSP